MAGIQFVTLGETMALLSAREIGPLRHAADLGVSVGGSESNVAIGLARLGVSTAWIGRVGSDEFGARVLRELRAEGVGVHARTSTTAPTGIMVKERRTSDTARVWYYRTASAGSELSADDLDPQLIAGAGVLHVTGITCGLSDSAREAVNLAVHQAKVAGVFVSVDLNYRAALWSPEDFAHVMRPVVAAADIVFGSWAEATYVIGAPASAEDQARALTTIGPRHAVVTMGAQGSVAVVDDRIHRQPAHPITVVDSVGAGDAFVAGWLAEHLADAPITDRLRTASACGAYACTVAGDWEGAPTWADLGRLEASGVDAVRR